MSYYYITMPLLAVHSDGERIVKQVAIHQQQLRIRCHLCPSVKISLVSSIGSTVLTSE